MCEGVCVCVCARARACVRVRVRVRVRVCACINYKGLNADVVCRLYPAVNLSFIIIIIIIRLSGRMWSAGGTRP